MRKSHPRIARQKTSQLFAVPAVIGVLSLAGLILGLTGEGPRDWLSWALISPPILAALYFWRRR